MVDGGRAEGTDAEGSAKGVRLEQGAADMLRLWTMVLMVIEGNEEMFCSMLLVDGNEVIRTG